MEREKVEVKKLQNLQIFIIHKQLMMFIKIWKTIIQQRKRES